MKLTIIRNDAQVPPGHIERVARARSFDIDLVRLDQGDSLPHPSSVEAVVVLGGEMGAYDIGSHEYLDTEKQFLADIVDAGVPVLGVCLGCQLLAESLGGRAFLADAPEVAFAPIDSIGGDPVVDILTTAPVLTMHRDTWEPPEGGRLLARSDSYNQAFRYGSALGLQPHPEVDPSIVGDWLSHPSADSMTRAAGTDPDLLLATMVAHTDEISDTADSFFGAWLDEAIDIGRGAN